jgi:hypothetical protein
MDRFYRSQYLDLGSFKRQPSWLHHLFLSTFSLLSQVGLLKPYVVFDVEKGRDVSHSRSRRNVAEAELAAALYWELR